jgi:hypothetical protein
MHRILIGGIVSALFATVSIATAAPSETLAPFPQPLPARCELLAQVPASATIPGPALGARVSVASCIADIAMSEIVPTPDDASIARLNAALAPAIALLDNVIRIGDPHWKVIAQDAKRSLYLGAIYRERASLTNADHPARDALEAKLAPWQAEVSRATVAIVELGRSDPELAKRNAVLAGIMARTNDERSPQVAGRPR